MQRVQDAQQQLQPEEDAEHLTVVYQRLQYVVTCLLITVPVLQPVVLGLHDPVKLLLIHLTVTVAVGLVNHLLDLVVCVVLTQLF